jgi:hypothetical protein
MTTGRGPMIRLHMAQDLKALLSIRSSQALGSETFVDKKELLIRGHIVSFLCFAKASNHAVRTSRKNYIPLPLPACSARCLLSSASNSRPCGIFHTSFGINADGYFLKPIISKIIFRPCWWFMQTFVGQIYAWVRNWLFLWRSLKSEISYSNNDLPFIHFEYYSNGYL